MLVGDAVVAPWTRMHDQARDGFFDAAARSLAAGYFLDPLPADEDERQPWRQAHAWVAQASASFPNRQLVLTPIEEREGQPRLALLLVDAQAREAPLRMDLELSRGPQGQPLLARVLDPLGSRSALACAKQSAELRVVATTEGPTCNVLGTLLPETCAEVPAKLRMGALQVGTECRGSAAFSLDVAEPEPAPPDFAVTLRRAGSLANLGARSQLSLASSGRVRLTRVARTDEGLTSSAMLGALWHAVTRLGWFERINTGISAHCAADERADATTIRAHGRERTLRDRDGCRGEFGADELETFKRTIEHAAALDAWQSHDTPESARDAEIWVVAAE